MNKPLKKTHHIPVPFDNRHLHKIYIDRLEKLRAEIDPAWNGPVSKRTIQDILASKTKR